jgi:hypothetical protein
MQLLIFLHPSRPYAILPAMGGYERIVYVAQGEFMPPFCEDAEVMYWLDLTQRLEMRHTGYPLPPAYRCQCAGQPELQFDVVWKREMFQETTALIINGPHAGHLALMYSPPAVVGIDRTFAVNGALFSADQALEHIADKDIAWQHKRKLQQKLSDFDINYPGIIADLLGWIGYPVDKKLFLGNIRKENLIWRPPERLLALSHRWKTE